MSTVKLNKGLRERIVFNALRDAFEGRYVALHSEGVALAREARDRRLGVHLDAWLAMPEELLDIRPRAMLVNVAGQVHPLPVTERPALLPWVYTRQTCGETVVRAPRQRLDLAASNTLGQRVVAWARCQERLESDISELRNELSALVASVTTVRKLVEVWPEVEPYLPTDLERSATALVDVHSINRRIAAAKEAG